MSTRRIRVLPDALVNQIAAGEVVDRPASVVKELVENALDAAATRIEVALQNGGKTEIRVADNGHGMGRDDALLALDRHATSKISEMDDLKGIRSFGFRGEALPSIAAVSRFLLESAEAGAVGTRIRVAGGRILGVEECARQVGTTITVRNLFHNVPARAKFMKTAAVETRAAAEVFTSLALANLSVALHLESNGRDLLALPPASDLVARVAEIWGDAVAERLLPLAGAGPGLRVAGLVDRPDAAGTAPRRTYVFVEGRPVRDRGILMAAERGYRTTVPHGARPSLLLYLSVDPGAVDVNVHPAKAEVKFRDRSAVEESVERVVREALGTAASAAPLGGRPGLPRLVGQGTVSPAPSDGPVPQFSLFVSAAPSGPAPSPGPDQIEAVRGDAGAASLAGDVAAQLPTLWQVHDTYLFAETRSGLIIVDQHSAHERVLFEVLMRELTEGQAESQRLLFPITLRLAPAEYAVFEDNRPLFTRAGFDVEPFGGRTVIVHSVPNPHPYFDAERCLREMVAELAEGSELTRAAKNQHERIASVFACKAAIKAGQRLSLQEMAELFDRLFATELPYHDVHGRPTVVRLSLHELERRFGRHG